MRKTGSTVEGITSDGRLKSGLLSAKPVGGGFNCFFEGGGITQAVILFASIILSTGSPVNRELMDSNDSQSVGSNINKVYAPAPFDDLQVASTGEKKHHNRGHESGKDDESGGYYTSKSTKGDNGYKHFDSYHKKGGDKYGFEKHSAYGKGTGGKKGGSHHTSSSYHEADGDDKGSESEYYSGEGTELKNKKLKNKKGPKDHKTAATDGDFYFSNYESEGEGDSEHVEGDEGHYEDEGGYFSEGYSEGGEGESEGYYDGEGEGESEAYYDGEGESRQRSVIHHGGPAPGATSYFVRHFN